MTTTNITQGRHTASRSMIASTLGIIKERHSAHTAERAFRRELQHYRSPAEINDLLAMLADRNDAQSRAMRDILARNLSHQV